MNDDRELLELAAKAAGIEYGWQHIYDDYEGSTSEKWDWNPLTDDGDALRLAAARYLVVAVMKATHEKPAFTAVYHFNGSEHMTEEHGNDAKAATRRAIVRSAAAIGETMK
jgi:hypothetical protein